MKKRLSKTKSDSTIRPLSFEFAPWDKSITIRVSNDLLAAVQSVAKERGTNYQKLIREAIERFLEEGGVIYAPRKTKAKIRTRWRKNGGGHWGTREEAKRVSKKVRRSNDKVVIRIEICPKSEIRRSVKG
ncbi:MAG: ribbon-helix-helix protein, CopG family [Bdellovibrionales bacterium]|nr:ribbon-helix-helix protein, CopG family [Bdellovibrionales bacterium]